PRPNEPARGLGNCALRPGNPRPHGSRPRTRTGLEQLAPSSDKNRVENSAAAPVFPWRQLGTLLADEGLLTDTELELALDEQRRTGRLLGQIVVDRGYLSAFSLARVLSAQHGLELQKPEEEPEPHLAEVPTTWRPL